MRNINDFIYEKLKLSSELSKNLSNSLTVNDLSKDADIHRMSRYLTYISIHAENTDYNKIKDAKNRKTSVKRMGQCFNVDVLAKRWWVAVKLKWDDAIIEWGKNMEKFDVSLNELHQYVAYWYHLPKNVKQGLSDKLNVNMNDCIEHYFELYDIEY